MKKRAALSIIFLFLPLVLLLAIAGCSSRDGSTNDITGSVIKDITAEPVGNQGSAGSGPGDSSPDASFDVACNVDSDCGDAAVGDDCLHLQVSGNSPVLLQRCEKRVHDPVQQGN